MKLSDAVLLMILSKRILTIVIYGCTESSLFLGSI